MISQDFNRKFKYKIKFEFEFEFNLNIYLYLYKIKQYHVMYGLKKKYKLILCIIWTSSKKLYNLNCIIIIFIHMHGVTH